LRPCRVGETSFITGHENTVYLIDASDKSVLRKIGETRTESDLKSPFCAVGNLVFAVLTNNQQERIVSLNASSGGLTVAAEAMLPVVSAAGPWSAGEYVLVRLDDDRLLAFDAGLNTKWEVELPPELLEGDPQVNGNSLWLYFASGRTWQLDLASGKKTSEQNLEQPIAHWPSRLNGRVIVSGRDGTVHALRGDQ
jgi:outer membrane protein assembly factor BamB